MRTQQYLRIMQLLEVVMVDGNQSHLSQSFTLHSVMNDIAQAIQRATFRQFLFRLAYGRGHTETEARPCVYLYLIHLLSLLMTTDRITLPF